MESDDSNFIDSDTEAYLYSQIYHETQGPLYDNIQESNVTNQTVLCDIRKKSYHKEDRNECAVKIERKRDVQNKGECDVNKEIKCKVKKEIKCDIKKERIEYDISKEKQEVNQKTDEKPTAETLKLCQKLNGSSGLKNDVTGASVFWSTSSSVPNGSPVEVRRKTLNRGSPLWSTFPSLNNPNVPQTGSNVKPTVESQPVSNSVANEKFNSVIQVLCDQELKAEKPNRTRSVKRPLSVTPKLSKKSELVKKIKLNCDLESTTDSDESAVKNFVENENQNVVIHVNPSTNVGAGQMELRQENNPSLWRINSEDRFKMHIRDYRMHIVCYNCRERGHLSKTCNQPKRMESCYLCGEPGHKGDSCTRPVCGKCFLPGHWQYQCHWKPNLSPPCPLCKNMGHLCQECPSIWRRYHLTTTSGPLKKVSDYPCQKKTTRYCYVCGREGHYAYACSRQKKNMYPPNRVVTKYQDPKTLIFRNVYVKQWTRRLKLCGQSNDTPQSTSIKTLKQLQKQHAKERRNQKKKRQKKMQKLLKKSETSDIIKINPGMETNFPRTTKKGKNVPGLTVTCWKGKTGNNSLRRTVLNNSVQT